MAIRPFHCFWEGAQRLRGSYFAFVAVATIVALCAQVPLGLLYWPLLVGVHLCFLEQERSGRIRIARVFEGFQDFMQALTIALLVLVAALGLAAVCLVFFFLAAFIARGLGFSEEVQVTYGFSCGSIVFLFAGGALHAAFGFAPHLLAERGLDGIDAVKVSIRAARMNLPGLLVLWWMFWLLATAASVCCLPLPFVFPFCLAAVVEAFRRVFGEAPETVSAPNDPMGTAEGA